MADLRSLIHRTPDDNNAAIYRANMTVITASKNIDKATKLAFSSDYDKIKEKLSLADLTALSRTVS